MVIPPHCLHIDMVQLYISEKKKKKRSFFAKSVVLPRRNISYSSSLGKIVNELCVSDLRVMNENA